MRSSWIEIDLDALRKNTAFIMSRLAPGAQLMAPVKGKLTYLRFSIVHSARLEVGDEKMIGIRFDGYRQPISSELLLVTPAAKESRGGPRK